MTYGPAGGSLAGQVPLRITTRLGRSPYYSVTAQLQGGGSVKCQILIGSTVISEAVATGGRKFAACQISRDPRSGRWRDGGSG